MICAMRVRPLASGLEWCVAPAVPPLVYPHLSNSRSGARRRRPAKPIRQTIRRHHRNAETRAFEQLPIAMQYGAVAISDGFVGPHVIGIRFLEPPELSPMRGQQGRQPDGEQRVFR